MPDQTLSPAPSRPKPPSRTTQETLGEELETPQAQTSPTYKRALQQRRREAMLKMEAIGSRMKQRLESSNKPFKYLISENGRRILESSDPKLGRKAAMLLQIRDDNITIDLPQPRLRAGRCIEGPQALTLHPSQFIDASQHRLFSPEEQALERSDELDLEQLYRLCKNMAPDELPPPIVACQRGDQISWTDCCVFPCYDHKKQSFSGIAIVPFRELDPVRRAILTKLFFQNTGSMIKTLETGKFEKTQSQTLDGKTTTRTLMLGPTNGQVTEKASNAVFVQDLRSEIPLVRKIAAEQFSAKNTEIDEWNAYVKRQNEAQSFTGRMKSFFSMGFSSHEEPRTEPSRKIPWCTLETIYHKHPGVTQRSRTRSKQELSSH